MSQVEWTEKYTKAVKGYLYAAQGYEMIEDHSDYDEPYLIANDPEDDSLVFILLRAWDDNDMPDEIDSEQRAWFEHRAAEFLSQEPELPRVQRMRFDIIDMLVFTKQALLRHHVNAMGEGL